MVLRALILVFTLLGFSGCLSNENNNTQVNNNYGDQNEDSDESDSDSKDDDDKDTINIYVNQESSQEVDVSVSSTKSLLRVEKSLLKDRNIFLDGLDSYGYGELSYTFQDGDRVICKGSAVCETLLEAGEHNISLTVIDESGNSSRAVSKVTVAE